VKVVSPEGWRKGCAEGSTPLITPPLVVLHLEKFVLDEGKEWRLTKFREKGEN
jgi:hypothetical protein